MEGACTSGAESGMPIMAVSPSPSPDPLLQCKTGELNYLQLQHFQIRLRYCWKTHQCLKTCHWMSLCLEHQLGIIFGDSCCHRQVRQKCTVWILQDTSRCSSIVPSESGLTSSTSLKERERVRNCSACHLLNPDHLFKLHLPFIFFFGHAVFCSILCVSPVDRHILYIGKLTKLTRLTWFKPIILWVAMPVDCWTASERKICLMR